MPRDAAEQDTNYSGYEVYLEGGFVQVRSAYLNQENPLSSDCESPPQPVAYWNFEEGSGTSAEDASGNNHTATLTNMDAATDWVTNVPTFSIRQQLCSRF